MQQRLTNISGWCGSPAIAVDDSNIYVVWEDGTLGSPEIYFKRSDDGGITWTADMRLTNNAGGSYSPAIAVNGSNIYVVWYDDTPGNYEIYFKRSGNGGASWGDNKRLRAANLGDAYSPAIAVDGLNIYVVWHDYTPGDSEIYFRKSDTGGGNWITKKSITNNAGGSYSPAIAVDSSDIYVVWYDDTPGNSEIYFKKSNDGGVTWTAGKKLTNNTGNSATPAMAVDGSNIYVVWSDDTPGDSEIYFKKGLIP
jgi:hypothetical protein